MASLLPCLACRRHLRHQETQCPFCGAQQPPPAAPRRPLVIPRDASRATLFALGLTLAGQACGGRTNDDHAQNGSGASTGNGSRARGGAGGGSAPGTTQETCADNPLLAGCDPSGMQEWCEANPLRPECSPTPPYGGIPRPVPGTAGAAGSGGTLNPSLDAGAEDSGGGDAAPDEDAGN